MLVFCLIKRRSRICNRFILDSVDLFQHPGLLAFVVSVSRYQMTGKETLDELTSCPSFSISCSTPTSSIHKKVIWCNVSAHHYIAPASVHKPRVLPSNPGGIIPINPRMFYTMAGSSGNSCCNSSGQSAGKSCSDNASGVSDSEPCD